MSDQVAWFGRSLVEAPEPRNVVKLQPHRPLTFRPTGATLYTLRTSSLAARNPDKLAMRVTGERLDRADPRGSWDISLPPEAAASAEGLLPMAIAHGQAITFSASGAPPTQHVTITVAPGH